MDARPSFGSRRRMGGGGRRPKNRGPRTEHHQQDTGPRQVTIEGPVTVAQFAEKVGVSATEIIRKVLLDMGEALTMNAVLSEEYMELLAPEFNAELEIIPVGDEYDIEPFIEKDDEERMRRRPPVVTIMGHVDHGKTSLLDYIRNSKVVEGEFGGITQHIGAYHVSTAKGDIVFLDTPGHEAFTSMRARGAGITDLVILVVAANDGFKPQTIEALNHAKAAEVPIVVAVNKIDLPGADPAKVRQEALQHNLVPEDFGGDTIFVDISAKQGTNVDQLLEMVALQSEILDLKADPGHRALGTIIESHVDPTRGAVATVLVETGTLKSGDYFVTGDISGRVRAMVNDRGKTVKEAGPAFPVEIIGLTGSPAAGEAFVVMPDEATARSVAEKRGIRRRASSLAPTTQKHITLEHLHEYIEEGKTQDLNIVLKADVQGSIEAVRQSLEKLSNAQIRIKILHGAVGGINESDVQLAAASDAVIIGFNVRPEQAAQEVATREGVDIKLYRIIYDLIEEVRQAMTGMLAPTFREKVLGHAEVRQLFRASRLGTIAGSYVRDGEIVRDSKVRIVRDNVVVYEGQLGSLRRVKEDVKKVASGAECGITIENFNDLKEGDIIESYEMEQIASTLEPANA
jgi:translation initiation factor IF-2